MEKRFIQLWKSGRSTFNIQNNPELERSCAGRLLRASTFIVIIVCLGLWITTFILLLQHHFFTERLSGNILNNLTCLTFFGGLVIAVFVGALAGNFLRRAFWKWLIQRRKRN
ncbi:MAG: hypothetical protein ABSF99_12070 [Anaerolineales bacterium]